MQNQTYVEKKNVHPLEVPLQAPQKAVGFPAWCPPHPWTGRWSALRRRWTVVRTTAGPCSSGFPTTSSRASTSAAFTLLARTSARSPATAAPTSATTPGTGANRACGSQVRRRFAGCWDSSPVSSQSAGVRDRRSYRCGHQGDPDQVRASHQQRFRGCRGDRCPNLGPGQRRHQQEPEDGREVRSHRRDASGGGFERAFHPGPGGHASGHDRSARHPVGQSRHRTGANRRRLATPGPRRKRDRRRSQPRATAPTTAPLSRATVATDPPPPAKATARPTAETASPASSTSSSWT